MLSKFLNTEESFLKPHKYEGKSPVKIITVRQFRSGVFFVKNCQCGQAGCARSGAMILIPVMDLFRKTHNVPYRNGRSVIKDGCSAHFSKDLMLI